MFVSISYSLCSQAKDCFSNVWLDAKDLLHLLLSEITTEILLTQCQLLLLHVVRRVIFRRIVLQFNESNENIIDVFVTAILDRGARAQTLLSQEAKAISVSLARGLMLTSRVTNF